MRWALLLTLLIPLSAYSSPAEEPPDNTIPILESARQLFGSNLNLAANRLDSFFATERADDEFGRSRIRIRSAYSIRERAVGINKNQYRINLKLPHLEDKFKYENYFQKDKDEKAVTSDENKEKVKKSKDFGGWIFNADMGVTAAIPPKLTTRARLRNNLKTGTLIHRFAEQLTYTTDENGLVEETTLDTDHIYSENLVFRFINIKRWQVLKKEFNTNHGPTLLHRISENDAFIYSTTFQTLIDNSSWFVNNYQIAVNYRRNLYKQWVYGDVIPGIDFPKEWSFRRTPFITVQLEILFGGS